jgi:hypothetical protein
VGVDIYRPYLNLARSQAYYPDEWVLLNLDALRLDEVFLPKSFDVVICFDVLEHLKKSDSLKVMAMCEGIARKAVCLEMPLGFIPQNMDIIGAGGDHWQTHRSTWDVQELLSYGYKVTTRAYEMANVQRHTSIAVDPHITLIDAIKRMDT